MGVQDWAECTGWLSARELSQAAIARRLGMSRNTVARLLAFPQPPRYERSRSCSKLDPFKAPGGSSAESLVVGELSDAVVEEAFAAMPEQFRQAVALVGIAQLSYQEAADTLGVPIGTVMSRVHPRPSAHA
jgi:DNA-directed RNA polymerase specialized sigma24 family protein